MSLWYIPRGTCKEKIGTNWPKYVAFMEEMEGKVFEKQGIYVGPRRCIKLNCYVFPEEYLIKVAD